MRNATRRHRAGFTLAETVVAGVVLTLSACVVGLIVTRGMRSLAQARDTQRAAELLDRVLTRIDLIGPAELLAADDTAGTFDPPDDRFAWDAAINPKDQGYLYDVIVRVSWTAGDGERRSAKAQTFLNDPPGARGAGQEGEGL